LRLPLSMLAGRFTTGCEPCPKTGRRICKPESGDGPTSRIRGAVGSAEGLCVCFRSSTAFLYNRGVVDAAFRDRVIKALWPSEVVDGTSVWAILDGARDERIYPALRTSRLDYRCLYSGRLPKALEAAAPHLIELAPAYSFTRKLIEQGWGNSWGIFLRIRDSSNLRYHLRTFLRVQDEAGRFLLFRYYDPRVLRVYLPTCRPDELTAVFGPIGSYLTESDDGRSLLEFEFDEGQLQQRRISLMATLSSASA
jgi:hypothetical protein